MVLDKSFNSDSFFLVLARPADMLSALVSSMLARHRTALVSCGSVYDLIAALPKIQPPRLVILITRPSMLAKPNLIPALHQFPNLRLIGWLGDSEKLSDVTVSALSEHGMVMVSSPRQLRSVIAALHNALVCEPESRNLEIPKLNSKIEPTDYRLSDEELDALLGADV